MASKKMQKLLILLFCAFIAVFSLLYIFLPKQDFSEKEKRALSSFPEASLASVFDGSFESAFETWLSDHIPARDALVGLHANYELFSGRNGLNGVIYDGEGRLVAAPEKISRENILRKCERIASFAQTSGIPTDVMIIPTAGYMLEERLPDPHGVYPDAQLASILEEGLPEGVGFIWPEEELRSLETGGLYYNTDHHFTSRGAYEACRIYLESIGAEMPAVENYEVSAAEGFYGSMYAKAGLWGVPPDSIEIWRSKSIGDVSVSFDDRESAGSMFFTEHLSEMDKYPVFLDGNHALVTIETENSGGENLLLIRDSFGHCFAPFAADSFHRVVLVDLRYYRKSVSELAREMQIDRALVLYGTDTFITDTNFAWLK